MTNLNNQAGTTLTEAEMDAIVAAAKRVGAWILADEVSHLKACICDSLACDCAHTQHIPAHRRCTVAQSC